MGSGLGNQPRDLATATGNGVWATATGNGLWATATGNGNLEAALLKHEGGATGGDGGRRRLRQPATKILRTN